MDLKTCYKCNTTMQYLDNDKNDYCYLICPNCHDVDTSETYVTCHERESQGYNRYIRAVENIVSWRMEHED